MIGLAVALGLLLSGDFGSAALVSFVAFCLMLMMDKIIGSGAQKSVQKNWILLSGALSLVSIILFILKY
tara:strand:+ start:253 stop:459 length:207 start_codon:yes stop_codon:yes gene_type:complete